MALVDQARVQHHRDEAGKLSGLQALVRNFESTQGRGEPVNIEPAAFTTARILGKDGQLEVTNLTGAVLNGALTPDKVPVLLSALQQSQRDKAEGEEQEKQKARDAWLRQQLLQLADIDRRLAVLAEQKTARGKVLADIRSGKGPDLDADGTLKDEKAEDAIRKYEEEHRTKIDRTDTAQVAQVEQDIGRQERGLAKQRGEIERGIKAKLEGAAQGEKMATVIGDEKAAHGEDGLNAGVAAIESVEKRVEVVRASGFGEAGTAFTAQFAIKDAAGADAPGGYTAGEDEFALGPATKGDASAEVGSRKQGDLTENYNTASRGEAVTTSLDPGLDPKPRGPG